RFELEHAGQETISDYSYNRVFGQWTNYSRLGQRRNVLATLVRFGWVRPYTGQNGDAVLHPSKRFYAGGSQSVRGYGENQLGPRILTLPADLLRRHSKCPAGIDITLCDPN